MNTTDLPAVSCGRTSPHTPHQHNPGIEVWCDGEPAPPTLAMCGNENPHPGHGWVHPLGGVDYTCPGLTGDEPAPTPLPTVPASGPLSGHCDECGAPAGHPCTFGHDQAYDGGPTVHSERQRIADLRDCEQGTCALCGGLLLRGSILGGPVEVWHPDPDTSPCPVLPDPVTDWLNHAAAVNLGARPGYPGAEHFQPASAEL